MKKLIPFLVAGTSIAGFVIACTGDDPNASDGPARGSLGGECSANNSCNTGLACVLVDGKARCANATADGGTLADTGTSVGPDSGSGDDDDDSGLPHCKFELTPTATECKDKVRCYPDKADAGDAGPNCIDMAATCSSSELLRWECNSPHYGCGACCITADLVPLTECNQATLNVLGTSGTKCIVETSCPANQIQLCQSNGQCRAGEYCKPAKIHSTFAVADSIFGICVK